MMIYRRLIPVLFFLTVVVNGCDSGPIDDINDYYAWLNEPEHGLVQEKSLGGLRFRVKYLPSDYLAYKYIESMDGNPAISKDSLMESYQNSICFMLTVGPDGREEGNNVMFRDISSHAEFSERAMQMNFQVKEMASLRYGREEHQAVIATLENVYELANERSVMLIFPKEPEQWTDSGLCDFIFDDRIFGTGISRFSFNLDNLKAVPRLEFR